ncbi:hypothetical protein BJX64DRAFT_293034 [Aspergillus heterothallicus]
MEIQTKDGRSNIEAFFNEPVPPAQTIGNNNEKAFMQDFIRSPSAGWTAEQIWILEATDKGAVLTRKLVVSNGSATEFARVIYYLA